MNRRDFFRLIGLASVVAPVLPTLANSAARHSGGYAVSTSTGMMHVAVGESITVNNPVVTTLEIDASRATRGLQEYEQALRRASDAMRLSLGQMSVDMQVSNDLALIEGCDAEHYSGA